MYVNIGGDFVVSSSDIVGVFDIDKLTVYGTNRIYLSKIEKRGKIINITQKLPKSFVICNNGFQNVVYISPLMASTITKRIAQNSLEFSGGV